MLTPFGKEVRKLRIDHSMLLRELADHLGVSVAWLSAVETGRKSVPNKLVDQIVKYFELDDNVAEALREAATISRNEFKLKLARGAEPERRELAAVLTRRFSELTPAEVRDIQEILNRRSS